MQSLSSHLTEKRAWAQGSWTCHMWSPSRRRLPLNHFTDLEKSGEQGEQLTSRQEGQLAFQAGQWACFKGECQELGHHRDGGSLIPEDQLETQGSLVEPAQFLLAARLAESGNAECLGLPSSWRGLSLLTRAVARFKRLNWTSAQSCQSSHPGWADWEGPGATHPGVMPAPEADPVCLTEHTTSKIFF